MGLLNKTLKKRNKMHIENCKMEWEMTQENLTKSGVGHIIPTTLLLAPTLIFKTSAHSCLYYFLCFLSRLQWKRQCCPGLQF